MSSDVDTKTKEERETEFMIGLAKLTRETGIIISGCGCCGSPSIDEASDAELIDPDAGYGYGNAKEVIWISHADALDWKNFSDSIVRPTLEFTGLRGFSRRSGGMMGWASRPRKGQQIRKDNK